MHGHGISIDELLQPQRSVGGKLILPAHKDWPEPYSQPCLRTGTATSSAAAYWMGFATKKAQLAVSDVTDARWGDFGDLDVSPAVIDCSLLMTSFGARSRNQRSMAAECSSKNAPTSSSSSSEQSESGGTDR
uniref:Uncharacterized protein n=1 Tax=Anopheles culicifacies TaxID=139723 RepID=A0A182MSI3_9DIPT